MICDTPSQALASDTILYAENPRLSCASSQTYASFCLHPPLDTHVFQINSAQKLFDLFEVAKSAQKPRNELVRHKTPNARRQSNSGQERDSQENTQNRENDNENDN